MGEIFICSLLSFVGFVFFHLVLTRLSPPRFFFKSIVLFLLVSSGLIIGLHFIDHRSFWYIVVFEFLFYFMWALYVIVLVNVQNSFSLGALQALLRQPDHRLSASDLSGFFAMDSSLEKRLEGLKVNGLLIEGSSGVLVLTTKGKVLAQTALFLRRAFRITEVG